MGEILDRINRLRANINEVAMSWPLEHVDLKVIAEIERRANASQSFRSFADNIRDKLSEAEAANMYERWSVVFDAFAEARTATLLLAGGAQLVERIIEGDAQSPDIRVVFDGTEFFVEVKSLHVAHGEEHNRRITDDAFISQCELESRLQESQQSVVISEFVVRPHASVHGFDYTGNSVRDVVNRLRSKLRDRVDEGQFQRGPTFLAVDLSMFPLFGSLRESALCAYPGFESSRAVSGEIWNAVFAKEGDDLYKHEDFEGAGNLDGCCDRNGFLIGHDFVSGVIVMDGKESCGLLRNQDSQVFAPFLTAVTDFQNDENNVLVGQFAPSRPDEFVEMVKIKAFELWRDRDSPLWDQGADWDAAKENLMIPSNVVL